VQLIELFRKAQQATVVALADLAEYRDTDTGEPVLRVARTTDLLARDLHAAGKFTTELDELLVEQIGLASMLHDVGKVSIPDAVLLKPGLLDDEERRLMQTHAGVGMRILARGDRIVGQRSYLTLAAEIDRVLDAPIGSALVQAVLRSCIVTVVTRECASHVHELVDSDVVSSKRVLTSDDKPITCVAFTL
jgi:hypothetical protein